MPHARRQTRLLLAAFAVAVGLLLAPLAGHAAAIKCDGKKVTIMGTPGNDTIVGKAGNDVIYGGGGNDRISGGPNGNDTICGGPGNDVIHGGRGYDTLLGGAGDDKLFGETGSDALFGGAGNDELFGFKGADHLHGGDGGDRLLGFKGPDVLDGGPGNDYADGQQGSDRIEGGAGEDTLLGDRGNDTIEGDGGNDRIEGGPGDDPTLDGGAGTDVVSGGPGIDHVNGGPGDGDVVSGDNGTDTLSGGPGANDIVSYASASRGGIVVNLAADKAKGDGHDVLSGFEDVVGSPQGDTIVGNSEPNRLDGGVGDDTLMSGGGGGEAFGGPGTDQCDGFSVENSCGHEPTPPAGLAAVTLNKGLAGSSLVIQGSPSADDMQISQGGGNWTVDDSVGVFAGEGCVNPAGNPNAVACEGDSSLRLVVVTGGNGDDRIVVDDSVPASAGVRINGNAGNDTLVGGNGNDVLEAGENYNGPDYGNDTLEGRGGNDVLYADPGADNLLGGPGNDLLVSSVAVCQGHTYDGGPGSDTVSYARSDAGVQVRLGGTGGPAGCGSPDHVLGDNESLEGSDGPDVLVGDSGPNSMLGHLGADVFLGKGGNDFIEAADGRRDKRIDCGPGNDEAITDRADPHPISC